MTDSSGATKMKVAEQTSAADRVRARSTTAAKTTETAGNTRFAEMAANPFHQAALNKALSPEEKQAAIAKLLVFPKDKALAAQRLAEYNLFLEWLQHQKQLMSQQLIDLTDTDAAAVLQTVIIEMNDGLNDFETKISPLIDFLNTINDLNAQGPDAIYNMYTEIERDKEFDATYTQQQAEIVAEVQRVQQGLTHYDDLIAEQQSKTKLAIFGGGLTNAAKAEIAKLERNKQQEIGNLAIIQQTAAELEAKKATATEQDEVKAKHKESFKAFLDLSGEEHTARQKEIVAAAKHFVTNSEDKIGSIRGHFDLNGKQVDRMRDAQSSMSMIHAILAEAVKDAETENQHLREAVAVAPDGENAVAKMTRERDKQDIEYHIETLSTSATNTLTAMADLAAAGVRINTARSINDRQKTETGILHSRGVASVADQISTVLNAVSAAAIGEASASAHNTLQNMSDLTNKIAQGSAISSAMEIEGTVMKVIKLAENTAMYVDTVRQQTDITREGMKKLRSGVDEMMALTEELNTSQRELEGVVADSRTDAPAKSDKAAPTAASGDTLQF